MDCTSSPIACELDRIADAMSGFDWNAFWTTLIATIIGALVASFIGLAVARMERPQPHFRADASRPSGYWFVDDGLLQVPVRVSNIGDGPAFDVSVQAVNGDGETNPVRVAKLDSGGSVEAAIRVRITGSDDVDPHSFEIVDGRVVYWPDGAAVVVRWQQPPARRRHRSRSLHLDDPFAGTGWAPTNS